MHRSRKARAFMLVAAGVLALFFLNVGVRLAGVESGAPSWSLGDVGEFLLVLVAMIAFVSGCLLLEQPRTGEASESTNPTQRRTS